MDFISRLDARKQGLRYFLSEKPCARNHKARRYTVSGACSECIREAGGRKGPPLYRDSPRAADKRSINTLWLRLYDEDWPMMRDTASALCVAAYPGEVFRDPPAPRNRASGTALYAVCVPSEYEQMVRDTAAGLLKARSPDIQEVRSRILHKVLALVE